MGQPFRLLVTGSRTWHDIAAIEHALAVILARHPEGVLLVHGACPRGADAIAAAYAARTPGYQVELDPGEARSGQRSLRMKSTGQGEFGNAYLTLPGKVAAGHHIKSSGWIKTKDVAAGG